MYIRLQKRTQRLIPHLLASIISCGSVAVITIVFLAYGGARQTHRVLSTSVGHLVMPNFSNYALTLLDCSYYGKYRVNSNTGLEMGRLWASAD
jgi:hypothetical protein